MLQEGWDWWQILGSLHNSLYRVILVSNNCAICYILDRYAYDQQKR